MSPDFNMHLIAGKHLAGVPGQNELPEACGPKTVGKADLSSATLLQAERLLGVAADRIEALLASRFQAFRVGQFRYDIRMLYAVKTGFAMPLADPCKVAETKALWDKLASDKPVCAAVQERRPLVYTADIFKFPEHRIPKFGAKEHACDYVRSRLKEKIEGLSAQALHRGTSLSAEAAWTSSSLGSPEYGNPDAVQGVITVPKNSIPVRELRRNLLFGLMNRGPGPYPVFSDTKICPDPRSARDPRFEARLADIYDQDPDMQAWFAQFDDLWKGREFDRDACMTTPYESNRGMTTFGGINKAARANVVLFGDPVFAAKQLSMGPRPADPKLKMPCIYAVNDTEWRRWCSANSLPVIRGDRWVRALHRSCFAMFAYKIRRYDSPAGQIFGAKDKDGNWLSKDGINACLARLDKASIDIETGELYLEDRKITPDALFGPIAPGTLDADELPPAVEQAIVRHEEKRRKKALQKERRVFVRAATRLRQMNCRVNMETFVTPNLYNLPKGSFEAVLNNTYLYRRVGERILAPLRVLSYKKAFGLSVSGLPNLSNTRIVAEDGTLLEGEALVQKRNYLLELSIDILSGELCDGRGQPVSMEAAFAGIRRTS